MSLLHHPSRTQLLLLFLFTSFLLFSSLESRADDRVNLKYKTVDKEITLVMQGLPYNSDVVLKDKHILYINDIITSTETGFAFLAGEGSVLPSKTRDQAFIVSVKLKRPSLVFHSFMKKDEDKLIDAIGVEWFFSKQNMFFHVGQYIFETRKAGATLKFTKEGIVLTGFDIRNGR